jgi:diacylglycerol kinase (ATP)
MNANKNQSLSVRMRFALAGLGHGLRTERSLRTQIIVLIGVALALLILRPAPLWWALVIVCSTTVIAAELFNTAIERLADHLHPQLHPEIRIVKDCAAAAVLCSSVGALGVAIALLVAIARS